MGHGDSDELTKMGDQARTAGAIVSGHWADVVPELEKLGLEDKWPHEPRDNIRVNISGGLIEYCIPELARYLLHLGVTVNIDLRNCLSTYKHINTNQPAHVEARRQLLLANFAGLDTTPEGPMKNRHLLTIEPAQT